MQSNILPNALSVRLLIGLSVANLDKGIDARERDRRTACRRALAIDILSGVYDAGTFTDGNGLWKGTREPMLAFETVQPGTEANLLKAQCTAEYLAEQLDQEAVGLTITRTYFEAVTPS